MLKSLQLSNFKGFEQYTLNFTRPTVLVGPNNAGKSTLITALRVCALMLRQARRRRATSQLRNERHSPLGHPFTSEQFDLVDENLRFELRDVETSVTLTFNNGCRIKAIWPEESVGDHPYFFLTDGRGAHLETTHAVTTHFPSLEVIPPLVPVEQREPILADLKYVRQHLQTRLASRHFRNQLLMLRNAGQWGDFMEFCEEWAEEIRLSPPSEQRIYHPRYESSVDVYFTEGRHEREIVWAGDGIQVYMQLLLQLFRLQGADTIVLDEPEVFLHANLQRRLMRAVMSVTQQPIVATHSTEIIVEADPGASVFVEKGRRRSIRTPDAATHAELAGPLGSVFNLRAARALKTDFALFVEGNETTILRELSQTIGYKRIANESRVTVASLGGVSNWQKLEGFHWLSEKLLNGALRGYVILDRDCQSDAERLERQHRLRDAGLHAHIWERREIESYLVNANVISRAADVPLDRASDALNRAIEEMRSDIEIDLVAARWEARADRSLHISTVLEQARSELDETWTTLEGKLKFCPAKDLLSNMNAILQREEGKSFSMMSLARHMTAEEIAGEMFAVLAAIDELIEPAVRGPYQRRVATSSY